jgi:hypothetical protein
MRICANLIESIGNESDLEVCNFYSLIILECLKSINEFILIEPSILLNDFAIFDQLKLIYEFLNQIGADFTTQLATLLKRICIIFYPDKAQIIDEMVELQIQNARQKYVREYIEKHLYSISFESHLYEQFDKQKSYILEIIEREYG